MLLEIPDHIAKHISLDEKELVLEFAIFLYEQEILSMRAAADFARISWVEFEQILAERGIALQECAGLRAAGRRERGQRIRGRCAGQ